MNKENIRIMIADDDESILDSIEMILDYEGYQVKTVSKNALPAILDEKPDLLLLDIWMSGEDGIDICRTLKSETATSTIPVLMISASKDIEKSALKAGADDFLPKPFEMNDLLSKIENLLEQKSRTK